MREIPAGQATLPRVSPETVQKLLFEVHSELGVFVEREAQQAIDVNPLLLDFSIATSLMLSEEHGQAVGALYLGESMLVHASIRDALEAEGKPMITVGRKTLESMPSPDLDEMGRSSPELLIALNSILKITEGKIDPEARGAMADAFLVSFALLLEQSRKGTQDEQVEQELEVENGPVPLVGRNIVRKALVQIILDRASYIEKVMTEVEKNSPSFFNNLVRSSRTTGSFPDMQEYLLSAALSAGTVMAGFKEKGLPVPRIEWKHVLKDLENVMRAKDTDEVGRLAQSFENGVIGEIARANSYLLNGHRVLTQARVLVGSNFFASRMGLIHGYHPFLAQMRADAANPNRPRLN